MAKITGKLQITLPKRIADAYRLRAGDEVDIQPAGYAIAIVPAASRRPGQTLAERLRHFDAATRRQRAREKEGKLSPAKDRGWRRADLYVRGRTG